MEIGSKVSCFLGNLLLWHEAWLAQRQGFPASPGLIARPADGTPALYAGGGAELDDHLKVPLLPSVPLRRSPYVGPTTRARLSSSWPSRCRAGSPWHRCGSPWHRCGSRRHPPSLARTKPLQFHGARLGQADWSLVPASFPISR